MMRLTRNKGIKIGIFILLIFALLAYFSVEIPSKGDPNKEDLQVYVSSYNTSTPIIYWEDTGRDNKILENLVPVFPILCFVREDFFNFIKGKKGIPNGYFQFAIFFSKLALLLMPKQNTSRFKGNSLLIQWL